MSTPIVGIVMGSDSDWATMSQAAEALSEFGIEYEVGVVSAHRSDASWCAGRHSIHRGSAKRWSVGSQNSWIGHQCRRCAGS